MADVAVAGPAEAAATPTRRAGGRKANRRIKRVMTVAKAQTKKAARNAGAVVAVAVAEVAATTAEGTTEVHLSRLPR